MSEEKLVGKGRLWGEAFGLAAIFFVSLFVSGIVGTIAYGFYLAGQGQTLDPTDIDGLSKVAFLFLPVATIITLIFIQVFLKKRGLKWSALGLGIPKNIGKAVLVGFGIFITAMIVSALINLGMTSFGYEQDLTAFNFLKGDFFMYIYLITVISWFSAGFAEEVVFRGFIMGNIAKALGNTNKAWIFAAFTQAVVFGLFHAYQGLNGVVATGIIALVFGLFYFYLRNLWPIIIAHGLVDVFGISMLYYEVDIPL